MNDGNSSMQPPRREFYAEVIFERRDGDHFYVHSPDIPGLHLAGRNFDELNSLLETAVKDIFWFNSQIIIDSIRWVPNLAEVSKKMKSPDELPSKEERRVYVVNVQRAA